VTHRLADLAAMVGAELVGDPDRLIDGVATLEAAGERDLSFLTNTRYREQARSSEAGAILVSRAISPDTLGGLGVDLVVCDDAYRALADLVTALFPVPEVESGVHETACVDATAQVIRVPGSMRSPSSAPGRRSRRERLSAPTAWSAADAGSAPVRCFIRTSWSMTAAGSAIG